MPDLVRPAGVLLNHGWLADDRDDRDWRQDVLAARAPMARLPAPSLLHVAPGDDDWPGPGRMFQADTGSCVAMSLAHASFCSFGLAGRKRVLPSPSFLYAVARAQEQVGHSRLSPLVDRGCYPRLALKGMRDVGWKSVLDHPFVPSRINKRPVDEDTFDAFPMQGLEWFNLSHLDGDERIGMVADCLMRGFPVIHGILVDGAYERHVGEDAVSSINLNDIRGGHMQSVLEVENDGTILDDNWWSSNWGMDGRVRIHPGIFGNDNYVEDVYALRFVPEAA